MTTADNTSNKVQKNNGTLFLNIAIMLTSFTVALVALPQELFFVVAIIVLVVLRIIEKDVSKSETRRSSILTRI
jgi:hypothetical protein